MSNSASSTTTPPLAPPSAGAGAKAPNNGHALMTGGATLLGCLATAWAAVLSLPSDPTTAPMGTQAALGLILQSPAVGVALAFSVVMITLAKRVGTAHRTALAAAHADAEVVRSSQAPLLTQIMPVWKSQLELARSHADDSANTLLAAFGEIDSRLDKAIQMTQEAATGFGDQGVDDLMRQNQDAMDQLLAPMRQALTSRDEMTAALETVTADLTALREVANQVRQLAKRTNMVALNASVEASRAGERGSGFVTVAQEVRQLALQSAEAGTKMLSLTGPLETKLQTLRTRTAVQESSDEALQAEAAASARSAIGGLLRSLGDVNRSTRGLHEAGQAVREQVERTLIGFQSQDRLNQMMGTIVTDIERMHEWLEQGGDLSAAQATSWLERLDSSYTMEEQRTQHHGQSAIERNSSVDFF